MAHPLHLSLERMLQRMEAQGDFNGLSGSGAPIDGLSKPAPSTLGKLAEEAGAKPVPVLLNIEIAEIRARLAAEMDPARRKAIMKELADKQTRLAIEIETQSRLG